MADLAINMCGIKSPNPFWLASAPPTNCGEQIMRAFDAGWGGAVWKTIGEPITNVSSRLASTNYQHKKMMGLTNVELITDRPLEVNLKEIYEVKKLYPKHAVIASIMVSTKDEWQGLVKKCIDAGADGLELNFGCPHGMCERGLGSAIGQEPKVISEITRWVKEVAKIPVLVKLTPNITDITEPGEAAVRAGADGLALINTIKSIANLNLDTFTAQPSIAKKFTSGGFSGAAVKPIALHMVTQLAINPKIGVPLSGMGGIADWYDAAQFIALGATSVQVCTAVMHHGYGIIEKMLQGLSNYLDEKGMSSIDELRGKALPHYSSWGALDLGYKAVATIDKEKCIGCQSCYIACLDGGHQCIHTTKELCQAYHGVSDHAQNVRLKQAPQQHQPQQLQGNTAQAKNSDTKKQVHIPFIDSSECVGCNLCSLVCPVQCITMQEVK